jgi:DNA-binding CsgD family transcriptional regulator
LVEDVFASPSGHVLDDNEAARITLDDLWHIAQIGPYASALLGRATAELLPRSVIELTHPDDVPKLLLGFARATTEANTRLRIRLRHQDRSWRTVRAAPTVTIDADGTSSFTLLLAADDEPETTDPALGPSEVAGHLRRLADRIEAAAILAPSVQDTDALEVSASLTPRQRDVVSRLLRGGRVASIAAELYVSESTVRNHLTAVYRQFGVHSQAELLAKLLHTAD